MHKLPDDLVLDLLISACKCTLGPGAVAMTARLRPVANALIWANLARNSSLGAANAFYAKQVQAQNIAHGSMFTFNVDVAGRRWTVPKDW